MTPHQLEQSLVKAIGNERHDEIADWYCKMLGRLIYLKAKIPNSAS